MKTAMLLMFGPTLSNGSLGRDELRNASELSEMTPNHAMDRSAKRQRRLVPVARCAPAPGHCKR